MLARIRQRREGHMIEDEAVVRAEFVENMSRCVGCNQNSGKAELEVAVMFCLEVLLPVNERCVESPE